MSDAVVLWVRVDGTWRHGTESEDVMAVELVGVAAITAGADEAMICAPGEHPSEIAYVISEHPDIPSVRVGP